MDYEREGTLSTNLDTLDEAAAVIKGLTASELTVLFTITVTASVIVLFLLSLFLVPGEWVLLSLPIGIGLGLFIGWHGATYIGVWKQDTPSYLFWGIITRYVQIKGINLIVTRLKFNFGFIPTQDWDNNSHK